MLELLSDYFRSVVKENEYKKNHWPEAKNALWPEDVRPEVE